MKTINRTTLFLAFTFVISFSLAGIYKLAGGDISNKIAYTVLATVYMFVPMISAIIVKRVIHKEKVSELLINFKINKWFFIAWGIWHAPLILMGHNYPQHPQIGLLMMTIWCILLTPLYIYVTIKSKSVIAAAIIHGTTNATAGIAILKISGGNDLTTGVMGLPGFIALTIFLAGLFIYDNWISKDKIFTNRISNYLD